MLIWFCLLTHVGEIIQLLWALFFMKVYSPKNVLCGVAGGFWGTMDPKTLQKYTWTMIKATSNFKIHLVGWKVIACISNRILLSSKNLTSLFWIKFENRFKHNRCNYCTLCFDRTNCKISEGGRDWSSMRLLLWYWVEIFIVSLGLGNRGSISMSISSMSC